MAMAVISTAGNRSARSGCYRPCDSQVSQGGREGGREGAGEGAGVGTGAGAGEEAGEGGGGRGSGGGSGVAYALWTHHYERLKVAVRAAVRIEQLMSRAMPEAETAFWASVLLSKAWPLFLNASHTPHSSLPPFLVTLQAMPEAETAFWASVLLSKAWPLFLNDLVSTKLMPKVAPWFLSRYKPPMLVRPSASTFPPDAGCSPMLLHPSMSAKVEVVKANFGDTAPVITSIKAFREGGGRNHVKLEASVEEAAACANNKTVLPAPTPLVASPLQSHLTLSMTRSWRRVLRQHECASSRELEASVELVGADNLSVQATAYVAGMGSIPWTAYITGLQLTGTMRVGLRLRYSLPFVDRFMLSFMRLWECCRGVMRVGLRFRRSLPFVDRVTLSFVRPPQVSCAIKVMGALDAASIPLVASYVVRACHGVGWGVLLCLCVLFLLPFPSHGLSHPPGNEQEYTLQNALKTSLCWVRARCPPTPHAHDSQPTGGGGRGEGSCLGAGPLYVCHPLNPVPPPPHPIHLQPNRLVVVDAVRAAAFVLDLPVPPPTPEEISIVTPRPITKAKSTLSAISKKFLSKKGKDGAAALPAVATLLVEVMEAKDLLAADSGGTSDPYVKGSIGAARFQTAVISKNLNPQWNQKFDVPVADWSLPESYTLVLRVKDYDMFSANDAIGRAQMDISAVRGAGRKEEWLPLVDGGNGKIRVAVEVKEDGGIGPSGSDSDPAGPSAVAAGGSAGGESGGAAVGGRGVERAASDASTCTLESYTHDSQSVSAACSEDAARVAAPTTATVVPHSSTSEVPPSPSLTPSSSSSAKSSSSWFRGLSSTGRGSRNSRSGSTTTSSQPTSLDETTPGATTPKEITPAPKTPKEGTPRSGSRSWSFKSGSLRRLGSGSGARLGIAVATVHVEVIEADSLVGADKIGTSDPYLKGSLGSSKFSTKIIFKTLCPRWNEKFSLPVKEWPPAGSPFLLKLNIFDRDMLTQHDPLGNAALDIMSLRDGARHALWVKLENVATGRVHVAVTVEDHLGPAETDDEENESVEGGEEGGDGKAGVNSAPTSAGHHG
ncbi:unnamed protein product [Closterium sp. NIES-65]|nr:unnamed protein product [Closterium sp. NIES-65]